MLFVAVREQILVSVRSIVASVIFPSTDSIFLRMFISNRLKMEQLDGWFDFKKYHIVRFVNNVPSDAFVDRV